MSGASGILRSLAQLGVISFIALWTNKAHPLAAALGRMTHSFSNNGPTDHCLPDATGSDVDVGCSSTTPASVAKEEPEQSGGNAPDRPAPVQVHRRIGSRLTGTGSLLNALAALVTVIGAVLALLFVFWPQLRPSSPPETYGATLDGAKVEPDVTLGDYLARGGARLAAKAPNLRSFTDDELRQPGAIITFEIVIEGYNGKTCVVRWSLHDAATGARLADDPRFVDQYAFPDKSITPNAPRDQIDAETWVLVPAGHGPYFVRLALFDPDGVRLASLDTAPFAGQPRPTASPTLRATVVVTPVLTPPSL